MPQSFGFGRTERRFGGYGRGLHSEGIQSGMSLNVKPNLCPVRMLCSARRCRRIGGRRGGRRCKGADGQGADALAELLGLDAQGRHTGCPSGFQWARILVESITLDRNTSARRRSLRRGCPPGRTRGCRGGNGWAAEITPELEGGDFADGVVAVGVLDEGEAALLAVDHAVTSWVTSIPVHKPSAISVS
jgi:hypothetical protein